MLYCIASHLCAKEDRGNASTGGENWVIYDARARNYLKGFVCAAACFALGWAIPPVDFQTKIVTNTVYKFKYPKFKDIYDTCVDNIDQRYGKDDKKTMKDECFQDATRQMDSLIKYKDVK